MNWLKTKFCSLILLAFIGLFLACTKGFDDVNKSIRPAQSTLGTFLKVDSTSIKTQTVLYDFTPSNRSLRALIGDYISPIFGKINSNTYLQFDAIFKITGFNIKYDSVALILDIQNGIPYYAIGDTLLVQNFKVYRLQNDLYDFPVTFPVSFNGSHTEQPTDLLGEFKLSKSKLLIENLTQYYLRIPLKDSFGQEIIDNYESYFIDNQTFQKKIKGIYIKSENNSAIWGLTGAKLRIYYHDFYANNNIKTPSTLDIPIGGNNGSRIRSLIIDRGGTPLANLTKTTPLEGETCYIQASTGVGTKVHFPFLKDFENSLGGKKIVVHKAELIVKADVASQNNGLKPPSQINAFALDENGNVKNGQESPFSIYEFTSNQETTNQFATKSDFNNGEYKILLTSYIQSILDEKRSINESLLLAADVKITSNTAPSLAELNGFMFYNKPNSPYNISLKLYYSIY